MSPYSTIKYLYTSDVGTDYIRQQRIYQNTDGSDVMPIPPKFFERVVPDDSVVELPDLESRHLVYEVQTQEGVSRYRLFLPFPPLSADIRTMIQQFVQLTSAEERCIFYKGESDGQ